jgi:hypothetical protein
MTLAIHDGFLFPVANKTKSVMEHVNASTQPYLLLLACRAGAGFAKGLVSGTFQSLFWSRVCSGYVQLIGHAMDVPSNQFFVYAKKKELREYAQREQEAAVNLMNYKEDQLQGRIARLIRHDKFILKVLDDLEEFRKLVLRKYQERSKKIQICANILLKLQDREPQIIIQFLNHCKQFQNFVSPISVDPLTETDVDLIVDVAEKVLQIGRRNWEADDMN